MQSGQEHRANGPLQPPPDDRPASSVADWSGRLAAYRSRLQQEPQFNPVWQLAFDISRALEGGRIGRGLLGAVAKHLSDRALMRRARRMRAYIGGCDGEAHAQALRDLVRGSAYLHGDKIAFVEFAARWRAPRHAVVFTGHPTFAMSERLRAVLVGLIEADSAEAMEACETALSQLAHAPDPDITLDLEHRQVQDAIANAQDAVDRINGMILEVARELYPDAWANLRPNPVEIGSWVGYDLDGRTDITWQTSLRYRLDEKRRQLHRLERATKEVIVRFADDAGIGARLNEAVHLLGREIIAVSAQEEAFSMALGDAGELSHAANALTERRPTDLRASLGKIEDLMAETLSRAAGEDARAQLARLLAMCGGRGLGTATIHIRINATQLHNAIRKPLGLEQITDVSSRVLLGKLDQLVATSDREAVNFATLAMETATAVRQLILCAQILKHVDGDAPIRLLIAECEHPFTVLAAVYFARLFGVDGRIDISPLFETPDALEQGARVIGGLLQTESYRRLIAERGRLCVQTGFSDSGRFIGQIPAALAIERLQGQLAELMRAEGLDKIEVRIFDTHGESMGRGGHPGSLRDRFAYLLSPWVRARYQERDLALVHETSFQGGDGYVLFGSRQLAFASLAAMLQSGQVDAGAAKDDRFYSDFDFSKDYFERVKSYQARLFEDANYRAALGAFGTNLLPGTGSRKSQRQYDSGRDGRVALADMRAIPQNAILQQLGYVLNVVSGIGDTVRYERERFAEMYAHSDRTRRLMSLVSDARRLSSIKTLVAYANLFDDAFWVTRPNQDQEPHLKEPCLFLGDLLRGDPRHDAMMHLASYLRKDSVHLHDVLRTIRSDATGTVDDGRMELDLLQAIRIALIKHIYLLAARVPRFSARNDVTQTEIMDLVLSLRVEEAVVQLKAAFPVSRPKSTDFQVDEPATYSGEDRSDYAAINQTLIDPMLEAYRVVLEITVGIAHHFAAHG